MLQAAAAQVEITPPLGTELCGYSTRPGPAAGVHDPLFARALVLDDGITRAGLVTSDLIGFDQALVEGIRAGVEQQGALPSAHLMLTATHTHAGPMISCLSRMGETDPRYLADLQERIVAAVCQAAASLVPARVGYALGQVAIGINRRQPGAAGISLGRNEAGPIDTDLAVLGVAREDGTPLALLLHHACHGTTLGGDNVLISADWPGRAVQVVAEAVPGAVVMLANGCCGDINPDPREQMEYVDRHGTTVGRAALALLADLKYQEAPVRVQSVPVTIPLQPLPPPEQVQATYQECVQRLRQAEGGDDPGAKRNARGSYQWAADLLRHALAGSEPEPPHSEVQALGLGEIGLVGLPGEPFVELGKHLKAVSPFPHTLVVGYANAMIGYLPTAAAFAEGGYEVEGAARWYGVCPLSPTTQSLIEEAALQALRAVAG